MRVRATGSPHSDKFDRALADFAVAYADQNEADYQRFREALEAGELA